METFFIKNLKQDCIFNQNPSHPIKNYSLMFKFEKLLFNHFSLEELLHPVLKKAENSNSYRSLCFFNSSVQQVTSVVMRLTSATCPRSVRERARMASVRRMFSKRTVALAELALLGWKKLQVTRFFCYHYHQQNYFEKLVEKCFNQSFSNLFSSLENFNIHVKNLLKQK